MMPRESTLPPKAVSQSSNHHHANRGASVRESQIPHSFREIYARLLTTVSQMRDGNGGPLRVIGVTSCGRNEGVSTVALNLARTASQMMQSDVLLVDAHLSSPAVHKYLAKPRTKGLSDFLLNLAELPDCQSDTSNKHLKVLSAGQARIATAPDGRSLIALFESLCRNFGLIIVDLPPVAEAAACLAFAQHLDGVLLVVAAERVEVSVAREALGTLRRADINVIGTVLNGTR